jgi:ABC-2 type transport system permease protein
VNRFPRTDFGWKWRALWGSLALDTWGVRVGKMISLVIIIGFAVGGTFFFHTIFRNLLALEGIGEPLMWRVIGITMVTVFALLIVSNLITGIATLYRSIEIPFLISRPVPYGRVFMSRFSDNLAYSSWSLAALGVPLIGAWGWVYHIPFFTILALCIFGLIPLILISAVVGSAFLMALVWVARKTSPRVATAVVLLVVCGFIGFMVSHRQRGFVVEGAARGSNVERYLATLGKEPKAQVLPPHWMAAAMRAVTRGENSRSAFLCALLTITAIVWTRWLGIWAGRYYYRSWTGFGEIARPKERGSPLKSAHKFQKGWFRNPLHAMLRKDLLQFTRSPSQWAQFLILFAFLLIYLLNLVYISSRLNFDNPYWKSLILFLNFAFSGFILATLSVRFVYPLISLEGRGFWVVRAAPVTINLLFWEKFFLAFVVFLGLCELIVYFSNSVLHIQGTMMVLTTTATFLMGATLTGLAIGMGALTPDFKDESPMRIASTPGGVLTVVFSLLYVGAMVAILSWPARGYFLYLQGRAPFPAAKAMTALTGIVALNLIVMLIPVISGRRALARRDF